MTRWWPSPAGRGHHRRVHVGPGRPQVAALAGPSILPWQLGGMQDRGAPRWHWRGALTHGDVSASPDPDPEPQVLTAASTSWAPDGRLATCFELAVAETSPRSVPESPDVSVVLRKRALAGYGFNVPTRTVVPAADAARDSPARGRVLPWDVGRGGCNGRTQLTVNVDIARQAGLAPLAVSWQWLHHIRPLLCAVGGIRGPGRFGGSSRPLNAALLAKARLTRGCW